MGRRRFLRGAGAALGGAALLPALGYGSGSASASPSVGAERPGHDPDELFWLGRFVEADRGYARRLRRDPDDAHAWAQRGYIALLSNRFADCEELLTRAVALAPDDRVSMRRLADCFVRQDDFARALPLLRDAGDDAQVAWYSSLRGTPYEVRGAQITRLPFPDLDPLPHIEVSLNGGEPRTFLLDTGGTTLGCSREVADEAGLRQVATMPGQIPGQTATLRLGVLDSLRLGDIELRNFPVHWAEEFTRPPLPDGSEPVGVIGTVLFYHFLTTMDYAGKGLVLRRRTRAQQRAVQAEARRAGADALPLWLAGDHFPCSVGSLNHLGPRVVCLDTGGPERGVDTTVEAAQQAGIDVDLSNPKPGLGGEVFPIVTDEARLGDATGRNVRGIAAWTLPFTEMFEFEVVANFTHEFFEPRAVTFDFMDMALYVTG